MFGSLRRAVRDYLLLMDERDIHDVLHTVRPALPKPRVTSSVSPLPVRGVDVNPRQPQSWPCCPCCAELPVPCLGVHSLPCRECGQDAS